MTAEAKQLDRRGLLAQPAIHSKARIRIFLLLLVSLLVLLPTVRVTYAQPIAETDPATNITATSATLNGIINPDVKPYFYNNWQFVISASGSGPQPNPSNMAPPSCAGSVTYAGPATPVSCQVTGLTSSTTYDFYLNACENNCLIPNQGPEVTSGSQLSFTTAFVPTTPPSVQTLPATDVTTTSATLNGIVTPNGDDTTWEFIIGEVGQEPGLPICLPFSHATVPGSAGPTPVSCQLTQASTPDPSSASFELVAWHADNIQQYGGVLTTSGMVGIMTNVYTSLTPPNPQPPGPAFDFALSISPSTASVVQGGTADYAVGVMYSDPSYVGTLINVQVTGLGPGMNYNLSESGDLTVTTDPTTPTGSYSISLIGSANGVTHQAAMTLIVMSATMQTAVASTSSVTTSSSSVLFDYSVTVSPSDQSVELGGHTSYVVSVVPMVGNPVPVSLTVVGCPGDVQWSFSPAAGVPPYTSTLNLDLSSASDNPAPYTLTIVATAGGNVKTTQVDLTIQARTAQTSSMASIENSSTQASASSDLIAMIQQNPLLIALGAIVVLLAAALVMKGRKKTTQPATATEGIRYCPGCGEPNPTTSNFCRKCGKTIS